MEQNDSEVNTQKSRIYVLDHSNETIVPETILDENGKIEWRLDVSVKNKKDQIVPSVVFDIPLSSGGRCTFHADMDKFHDLRFKVATVLKEMCKLEESQRK